MRNSRPDRHVGTLLAGRYRLDRLIANGGMAQVWEATDETLVRRVAVKILHDHLADPTTIARFRAEGTAAARLRHHGAVAIYDTCLDRGVDAIVMEYVEGPTLRQRLDHAGRLSPSDAIGIAVEVADALEAAHRLGLVHRDVKPGNILLCADGTVKITDFGIAKIRGAGADLTLPGTFLGTAKYLSPEQVEGGPVDGRTDVYSLGVVLYEMLCGGVPFDGPSDAAIALGRLQRAPTPARELRPDLPIALEGVLARAMARRPEDRYPTMSDLRVALQAVDAGAIRPLTDATRTLPTPGPRQRFAESERAWLVPAVFVVVVAVSLAVAAILIGRTDTGHEIVRRAREAVGAAGTPSSATTSPPAVTPGSVRPVRAESFDPPPGDGAEHDAELANLLDGDPATIWTTEGYNARAFGTKSGVGLVLELAVSSRLDALTVHSDTPGWAGEVHLSDSPGSRLDAWGVAIDHHTQIDGSQQFDLQGRSGRFVLLWITDLGAGARPRVEIRDIELRARP
jgi:serine/threonine-protein kinase